MCLAVPVTVVECLEHDMVRVCVGDSKTHLNVSTMLLPETPKVGDQLIVHAGFALRVLDPQEAEESMTLLLQLAGMDQIAQSRE